MPDKEDTYEKTGTAGAEGVDFQLNLILHVLLQVKKLELVSFKLYTELKTAGKFDDIVLIYEDENKKDRCCLLQAKHVIVESKKVSIHDLISGDKYNLTKYFDSFKEIIKEEQFQDTLEHLILFTNLNLSESLLPYVEEFQPQLPIWNCQTVKGINKKPQLYKLNSQFIDEYQYSQVRVLSNVILDYCIKGNELKHTNNNFNDCHVLLAREVFNVEEKCFRKEFIGGEQLLSETKLFRDIFVEELQRRRNDESICINDDTPKWMQNQKLKFSKEFGQPSSKSKKSDSWPILLKNDDDRKLFTEFCSYLILALNQPNDGELDESLTSECAKCFGQLMANVAKDKSKANIRQWLKTPKSPPLTCKFLDGVIIYLAENEKEFTDLYVKSEIAELLNQKIEFESLSLLNDIKMFMNTREKNLLQITTRNSDLSSIKTISSLNKLNHEYLFTSKSTIRELKKVFRRSTCYNVFVWRILTNSTSDFEFFLYQLNDIIDDIEDKGKKVIVITNEGQSVSATQLGAPDEKIQLINDETKYGHLTEDTRNKLLKRHVSFQGSEMEINEILLNDFPLDQVPHDSWGDLLGSGHIQVGQKVNLSKEFNSNYYIPRMIVRANSNARSEQSLNEVEFIQNTLQDDLRLSNEAKSAIVYNYVGCEIFILSDLAGMGKTTVTSSVANEIKRIHPQYWVTRLVAMECASDLNNCDETTSDAAYDDFFMSKLLKLASPLERFVFGQYLKYDKSVNKLVIIFDGYDEINEKCQRVIVNLLQYLRRKPNIGFIVITTRPQFQQDLEEHFQRKACIQRPFDEKNKIEFLRRYWTSKDMKENNQKLTEYAEQLIKCISGSITEEESQLTAIPLQMRMIAEIYEAEARSYALNEEKDFCLSTISLGLFDLYEKIKVDMKIKVDICLKDKLEDKGSTSNTKQITSSLHHQSKFAREIILERSDVAQVEVPDLELTTQLGIIQKSPEGDFHFIHRTFAEFLTAKYILEEFIEKDSVPVVDKIKNGLLIEEIKKSSFYVVRKFINSRLDSAKLADECKRSDDREVIEGLLVDKFRSIIVISAQEEIDEFIKLTIEVNSWLRPDLMFSKLKEPLLIAASYSKWLKALLNCMLDKWLPTEDVILVKTVDYLIRELLVSENAIGQDVSEASESIIDFQNKLVSAGVLTEEGLRSILSNARDDVVNRSMYWNWVSFKYWKLLHSRHRNLFYDFFNDNRTFLHTIMKKCYSGYFRDFLSLIQSDKEMIANWMYNNFIENQFVEFGEWGDEHFELYFSILYSSAEKFHSERKEKFRNYLEKIVLILYRQRDLSFKGLFAKFSLSYETIISLDEILLKFENTKTTADLEYCAFWGQTNKLKNILEGGDIEAAAVERFQLAGCTHDLAATRRRILISIREHQGEEEFLHWIGRQNGRNRTILQHALREEDDLIIELIPKWITSEEIFEKTMRMDCDVIYNSSEYVLFLNFVNERIPQYRLRFLEINKNFSILDPTAREELLRIIENVKNMSKIEFEQILKLQAVQPGYIGITILYSILFVGDIGVLPKWLNLMKKFSLDSETIAQVFHIENENNVSPLHFIRYDPNYVRREKKKKICFDFFDELNLLELKEEMIDFENRIDNRDERESDNERN